MSAEDPTPHLDRYATYEEACREFRLNLPQHFNIAEAICRRHPDPVTRVSLIEARPAANNTYTVGALDYFSDKFAAVLAGAGIVHGDAVAVILGQSAALAVAHLGILKLGAVVVPLSPGMNPEQNESLLKRTAARALIIGEENRGDVPIEAGDKASLRAAFVVADAIHSHLVKGGDRSFWREVYEASSDFQTAETAATTPALIFCAKRGNDAPRIVVHSHASLIGSLAAFEMMNNFELSDAVLWATGDWASMEELFGVIYPALYYGVPIVAGVSRGLAGDGCFKVIEACGVTTAVLAAAQLRAWMGSHPKPRERSHLTLKRVIVTGTSPTREMIDWARKDLSVSVDSAHFNIEAGPIAATCERWFSASAGAIGRPVPGRTIEILDREGAESPRGVSGRIAVRMPDHSVLVYRMNKPGEGPAVQADDWFVTEEVGMKDEDGSLRVG